MGCGTSASPGSNPAGRWKWSSPSRRCGT
jgi:hypothetical protein